MDGSNFSNSTPVETSTIDSKPQIAQLKQNWILWSKVIFLSFCLLLLNQWIEQLLNIEMQKAMKKESSQLLILGTGLFLNGFLFIWIETIGFLILLQPFNPQTENIMMPTKIADFTREWLRSVGNASLWMFVFIIPGIMRWVDYTLLPFVCFFDSQYQSGQVDALDRCRSLAKGMRLKLWLLWLGLGVALPLITTSLFSEYGSLLETPISALLLIAFNACIQTFVLNLLWRLFHNKTLVAPLGSIN